ncbi:beta-ketoacyl-[acyl-carrier-protein] synthase family protein [Actinoplanes sp. RD1]|uniref:beta-ketoacyl-[acyl-carrier-protein] synthase family protein n=1 Tax=Actinoplanes sp. RD1 TaxID=3064538 RepID=UPI0027421791|nr:beta-ketoacyl-[acyl-carrier-protein] synthase family protein [Actinoplanes sp. RD1]
MTTDDDRIVVTGMGVVTPIGASVESFWQANLDGVSGIRREDRMDLAELPCGWVAGLIPEEIKRDVRERYGRPGRSWGDALMHAAIDQAVGDAGLTGTSARRAGLVWARVWPGPSGSEPADYVTHLRELADRYEAVGNDPEGVVSRLRGKQLPLEVADLSAFPAEVSERLGVPVVPMRLEATCAGGLRAIAEAARMLRLGKAEVAIVSASVSRNTPYVLSQYAQLMALSRWKGDPEQSSMPFDRRRSGMVINESAGAVVLETAGHARRRGMDEAHVVVGGWGLAVGTDHMTAPNAGAVERVMRTALAESRTAPEDIGSVNAHGTSTRLNDVTEARALRRVFGERLATLPVAAVKSLTGHGSAASGVVETVASALTLTRGVVPPVVTCTEPDPACGVATALEPREVPARKLLKNSFGFGGQYASMVFERPDRPRS